MEFGGEADKQEQYYHLVIEAQEESRQQSYHPAIKSEREVKFVPKLPDWETGNTGPNSQLSY